MLNELRIDASYEKTLDANEAVDFWDDSRRNGGWRSGFGDTSRRKVTKPFEVRLFAQLVLNSSSVMYRYSTV